MRILVMTFIIGLITFWSESLIADVLFSSDLDKFGPKTEETLEDNNKAWPGMFFTSESVVEEYEYDDAYCLLYDDPDANMLNVEICVDLETYQIVMDAIKNDRKLVGKLVLNEDYTTEELQVFTYMTDPEFEMAEASANLRADIK